MDPRHDESRRDPPLIPPPGTGAPGPVLILLLLELEDPLMDKEERLLGRGEVRGAAIGLAAAIVGGLDDALVVAGDEVVDVDPGTGFLLEGVDDGSGLADDGAGLGGGAEDAEGGGSGGGGRGGERRGWGRG